MVREIELTDGRFRAMGSDCRVVSDRGDRAVAHAMQRIEDLEERWSRFRTDSEISACNLHAGEWVEVSSTTLALIERAVTAFERTAGRFHPLMLRELIDLGYDRSHELLDEPIGELLEDTGPRRRAVEDSISIDDNGVRIPRGTAFDPGGLGKGVAADLVVTDLLEAGARWAVVSIGKDLRIAGAGIADRGWPVDVYNPWNLDVRWASARMHAGALSSSSTLDRRWSRGDDDAHHILDSQTGLPTSGSRIAATVHATDAWWADVVAKCLLVDDELDAETLEEWGAVAIAFLESGGVEELGWSAQSLLAVAS